MFVAFELILKLNFIRKNLKNCFASNWQSEMNSNKEKWHVMNNVIREFRVEKNVSLLLWLFIDIAFHLIAGDDSSAFVRVGFVSFSPYGFEGKLVLPIRVHLKAIFTLQINLWMNSSSFSFPSSSVFFFFFSNEIYKCGVDDAFMEMRICSLSRRLNFYKTWIGFSVSIRTQERQNKRK